MEDQVSQAAPRVNFADGDDNSIPLLWAERGIRWLRASRPEVFRDMMMHVLGVEKTRKPRNRPAAGQ